MRIFIICCAWFLTAGFVYGQSGPAVMSVDPIQPKIPNLEEIEKDTVHGRVFFDGPVAHVEGSRLVENVNFASEACPVFFQQHLGAGVMNRPNDFFKHVWQACGWVEAHPGLEDDTHGLHDFLVASRDVFKKEEEKIKNLLAQRRSGVGQGFFNPSSMQWVTDSGYYLISRDGNLPIVMRWIDKEREYESISAKK